SPGPWTSCAGWNGEAMQLEVIQRKENPLLKRTEVSFKAIHKAEPTPTRDALRAFLARELKATKDIVVIDSQASTFGRYETVGYAKVYKTKEEALAVERKHILVRNKLIEPEVTAKKEKGVAGLKRKFYKIDGNRISRERANCPKCGPGVFLAKHADRMSCGRCGYTEFAKK